MDRIAILAAMEQEIAHLREALVVDPDATTSAGPRTGGRSFLAGKLWDIPVVLAWSRWGKVAAAVTTTHILTRYSPCELVFIGVAGSLQPQVAVGDMVIAQTLVQHDMDASPLFARFEVPMLGVSRFPTEQRLREHLLRAAVDFLAEDSPQVVPAAAAAAFGLGSPCGHVGQIASGDRFISGTVQAAEIRQRLPKALCVEMEGAAVAQVCYEHSVPFGVLRIISDAADDNAHVDFPAFMDQVAAHYSLGVIRRLLQSIHG